jgi:hypothetical protein
MRLHRRLLRLDGRALTILTLRPGSTARYATNVFHGTPHVLTDVAGAQVLGRLLWGLAYQPHPQTAVLIDRTRLDPNPFDAEPSVPVLFAVADRTVLDTGMLRALRRALPLTDAPDGTVGWSTPGLDRAVDELRTWREARRRPAHRRTPDQMRTVARPVRHRGGHATRIEQVGGLLVHVAAPGLLRRWAPAVATMGDQLVDGTDYEYLHDPGDARVDGEVQVFADYAERVEVARLARAEVLAAPDAPTDPASVREAVWACGAGMRARRRKRVAALVDDERPGQ